MKTLIWVACVLTAFGCLAQRPVKENEPLQFINPFGGSIRRGQTTIIEWTGGSINVDKELSLYKGDKLVTSFEKMKGVRLYQWKVSKHLPTGDDYNFRLSGEGETLVGGTFKIRPQIPLLVKLSPLLLVAAIIPLLNNGGGEGTHDLSPLPGAPDPQ